MRVVRFLAAISRPTLAFIALVVIIKSSWEPSWTRYLFADEQKLSEERFAPAPLELDRFLHRVRLSTPPGSTIGLILPPNEGITRRAKYVLAGRRVFRHSADRPDFIAFWKSDEQLSSYRTLWSAEDGSLARRID